MFERLHMSMGNPVEGGDAGLDWYMNKSYQSRTVKVLSSVHGGYCKMRFMEELLRGHDVPHHARSAQPKTEVSACEGSLDVANATEPAYNSNADWPEHDEDDDIGNMTLKEMCQLFKKSVLKSSEKQTFSMSASVCPPWGNVPAVDRMPISDCSLQSSGLQLHLDSSTSNSAESSDDVSPRGMATSFHKPVDSVVHDVEAVVQLAVCPGQSPKKRKSTMDLVVCKSETSVEDDDDDCTLEMWQVHTRRSYVGKKSRRCGGLEPTPCEDEQTACESSMTPASTSVLSSANLASGIDNHLLNADSIRPSHVSGALGEFEEGFSAPPCSFDLSEELKSNSLKPQICLITSAIDIEGDGFKSDRPRSAAFTHKTAEISREDVKNDEKSQRHVESSPVCSSGELSQGDESRQIPVPAEAASWLLKPCSKSSSVEVSAPIHGKFEKSKGQVPTSSCEILHSTGRDSNIAAMAESGQRAPVEEICCSYNNSNSAASLTKSDVPPLGTTNGLVNNEVGDLSWKSSDGISPVDLSTYSPPLSAKQNCGFNTAEKSNNNVTMASQVPLDEDTSGSPVSLFSTERLDTEEEQELEQVKPSKIPSKRKAISPLSRERLLHASKFGDHEQNFADLDKRGLKKLPRAFKGFIGRDTFSQDRVAAFSRAKSSIALELSPPQKPHLKEEVLPGSPCHNREKFLPSKHLASSISSSYGSSCAAALVAPAMQTSCPSPSYVQRLSLVLNNSPSPPSQKVVTAMSSKSPLNNSSPPVPAKGILRSSSPTCQGACKCEECRSLRSRAEKAAEFSQRQMHDIEGLAVKLLKELNTMRCVVEESLIHRNAPRTDSPRSVALSLEQVKKAASNAFETEKMAKSWLVRMARDCNRYCKIMRMQERKLSFADESGGQLCHVKLFHAQAQGQPDTMPCSTEKPTMSSPPTEKGNAGLTEDELALVIASK